MEEASEPVAAFDQAVGTFAFPAGVAFAYSVTSTREPSTLSEMMGGGNRVPLLTIEETWTHRELPILKLAYVAAEANRSAQVDDIAETLGLSYIEARNTVKALQDDGYLTAYWPGAMQGGEIMSIMEFPRFRGHLL